MSSALWVLVFGAGLGLIVWGAESFAEHLGRASVALGVSAFALALLLAGAEPEELATVVTASARRVPGVAFGDVIGANVAMCLVALGVGALVSPLPFGPRVRRYGLLGLPAGAVCAAIVWGGRVSRIQGALLVGLYVAYVGFIWMVEGRPPALGEVAEVEEARQSAAVRVGERGRVTADVGIVIAGVAAMAGGGVLLVEAARRLAHVSDTQTVLGLTLVGFATAFELVALAWSAARRGAEEAVVAAVAGSFAYNATMTLGAAALVRPLALHDTALLHVPLLMMLGAIVLVIALGWRATALNRRAGVVLVACYPLFVAVVLLLR